MNTTLIIEGGLGRTITAIPALRKFVLQNPNTLIITGYANSLIYADLFYGDRLLSKKVFDFNTKNLFEMIKDTIIIKPEPYFNSEYLNGRINMLDAWNQEINKDKEKMQIPELYLTQDELRLSYEIRKTIPNKLIAFQPFGSSLEIVNNQVSDPTHRSLSLKTTQELINCLIKNNYAVWFFNDKEIPGLNLQGCFQYYPKTVREILCFIFHCNYFLGIDSVGQHIARCFNRPGTVIMGGSNTINVTYPDHFKIFNEQPNKTYMPMRLGEFDWWLSKILNEDIMNFNDEKINKLCRKVIKHIKKTI